MRQANNAMLSVIWSSL